jgi:biotin operon repressor
VAGSIALFEKLKQLLPDESGRPSQAQIANELGMKENAVKQAFHRLRRRYPIVAANQMGHATTDVLFKHYRNYRISKKDAEAYWKIAPTSSDNKVVSFPPAAA